MVNIVYKSEEIETFYKENRFKWDDFYPSEKVILKKISLVNEAKVLDLGCGCGGLGSALKEEFGITKYTGVDINEKAILTAQKLLPQFQFIEGDILSIPESRIQKASFDLVTSLSCIDWNVEFIKMLKTAMSYTKKGGYFISSFRLSNQNHQEKSYQYINFQGKREGETAPYVILNPKWLFKTFLQFKPKKIIGHGYWGVPSKTAVTPYEKIFFAVLAIEVGPTDAPCEFLLDLPNEIKGIYAEK